MQAFDASSIIYAWDNYPLNQFPGLWRWMASKIEGNEFSICLIALEEIGHKIPECFDWLKAVDIQKSAITNEVVQEALGIKTLLGIEEENYHPNGVDENDILIISSAKLQEI